MKSLGRRKELCYTELSLKSFRKKWYVCVCVCARMCACAHVCVEREHKIIKQKGLNEVVKNTCILFIFATCLSMKLFSNKV